MTKPRLSTQREIYGLLGSFPNVSELLKQWNDDFRSRGIDVTMEHYPTTEKNLPERLSEMYHFDRRLYIVAIPLQKAIIPFLDLLSPAARRRGVQIVINDNGVLKGDVERASSSVSLSSL